MDRERLFAEKEATRLPDAVFLVSSLPSPTMRYLVTRHDYRLVALPFGEALALESLDRSAQDRQQAVNAHTVLGRIQPTTIPAYTYSIEPPVPEKPLPTLGTRLLLVAHKDVPSRAVVQLVEGTYSSDFGQLVHPPLDARLMDLPPEFPWHDGALLYQQRNAPLLSGTVMDSAHKAFAIFAAAASGLFVLWQWAKLYRHAARDRGFKEYITQVTRIEERALKAERGMPLAVSEIALLRERICQLKTEALDKFVGAELANKELLFGFLVQANDVRDFLTRLIVREESETNERLSSSSGG
jgi:hypothetical protein